MQTGTRRYLARPRILHLHGVTGAMAVEILAGHIPATDGAAALAQVRAEHAALYAATAPVTQPPPASPPGSDLTGAAVRSLDPHQVKLVEACRRCGRRADRPTAAAARHDSLRGRKILLVDDDPRNAFALTNALELYGLTVVRACDGRKAIGQLAADDIDLVLMDVMMPQLDGHQTMREIRQMPQFAHLPVIAVTARAMHGDRDKSLAAGASDYVTKPVDIEELLNRMERWLSPTPESSPFD